MKIRKWIFRSLLTIVILLILVLAIVYVGSEIKLSHKYDVALTSIRIPSDSASLREGKRLANIFHCSGCHNQDLSGKVFFAIENVATVVAPNISESMKQYTNEELARLIRHGINKDGKGLWMPISSQYYQMSDDDLGKLIAYLRTVPQVTSTVNNKTTIHLLGRIGVMTNQFVQAAATIDHNAQRIRKDTSQLVLGKYYAQTVCAACHGNDLAGVPDPAHPSPSLIIAKAYSEDQFSHLMKTGEGVARKDLGLMSIMSKYHFSHFTDHEVKSIYTFLQTLQ